MSIKAFGERFSACPEPEFALPGIRELPALSFPLGLLLRSLRPKGVLELFAAILQEGRILLHSAKPALLAAVAEGVFALMYPLQWPYAYVPVLPNCLIEHVESPQPFILGVHTDWLSDIAPDALEELIIVDCDLGIVDGQGMEQLPPPVRRSLTKAVRAVLHGNLGGLDAPARLSKPEAAAGATATGRRAAKGGVPSSSSSSVQKSGALASGSVGAVGLSAWTDRDRRGAVASGDRAVGQGGGEKSAEVGGDQYLGGGRRSGGEVVVRKARRGRARGAAARVEALLRLEFARAMADMLYGFTECLFFLHPDRPIFNGARFLQEYCEESYVPFMSVVIDTLAFKYLLETQDTPPLRPFHELLDKARRDALRKGGDHRKHQMILAPQVPDEPPTAGAFDGPFPVVNGFDEVVVSRPKSSDAPTAAAAGAAGTDAAAAGGEARLVGGAALPPPAFAIPSPPLRSFAQHGGDDDDDRQGKEEVDLNASRGKEGDGAGNREAGSRDGGGSGAGGGGGGGVSQEMEHAAEEAREEERHAPSSGGDATAAAAGNGLGVTGAAAAAAAAVPRRKSDGGGRARSTSGEGSGTKGRAKREERSGLRLSDARGSFIGSSTPVKAAAAVTGRAEEQDEMAAEGEEEEDKGGGGRGSGGGGGLRRRGSGASSFNYVRRRTSASEEGEVCYDSAGDWGSDGSDGMPAVLANRRRSAAADDEAPPPAAEAAAAGDSEEHARSLRGSDVGANSDPVQEKETLPAAAGGGGGGAAVVRAGQSAGESALEEEQPRSSELTVGEGTAPPPSSSLGGSDRRPQGIPQGRAAALAAAFEHRNTGGSGSGGSSVKGGGTGGAGGAGWGSVRERVAALSAKSGEGATGGAGGGSGGGKNKVRTFTSGSRKLWQDGSGGGDGEDDSSAPPRRPSLALHVSSNTAVDEFDAAVSRAGKKMSRAWPPATDLTSPPSSAAPAALIEEEEEEEAPSLCGPAGAGTTAGASKDAAPTVESAVTVTRPAAAEAIEEKEAVAPDAVEAGPSRRESGAPPNPFVGARKRSSGGGSVSVEDGAPAHRRRESSSEDSDDDEGYYEPVLAPLSLVNWSHEPLLALGDCDLPQPREWTLADIGKEAGAGLAAAAAAGAGDGEELDRDSEKLLQCLEAVYSSDRVSEEVVMDVEETLRTKPVVQKMFLQVLRHASRRGYASSRGPTLLHGPSFETLARFSYTLLCVCVDRVDYSVAHTLLQLTGNYFQACILLINSRVHEGGGDMFRGQPGG
ncbi:unnamed protein product, partial [Ectocarpus sp. 12 AP-2014]